MPDRRWDTDDRFTGVRDAAAFAEPIRRLLETLASPGWVAEEPEAHLVPHLEAAAADLGLTLERWQIVDGVLELDVDIADRPPNAGRAAAHALVASIAEGSTHVREVKPETFEVVTGMLPGDGSFATHGHMVLIRTHQGRSR